MFGLETQQASLQTLLCLHESFSRVGMGKAKYIGNALFSLDETIVPTDHTDRNPKNITTGTCKLQTKPIIKDQPPAEKINDEDFTPLPPKRTSGKNALRPKCRNLMKEISGLTFLMEEKEQLSSLANDLEGILKKARSWAPQEAGVIIQNPQVKKNSKTISKKKHQKKNGEQKANLKTLRTRAYGRPKHPYTGRVGKHAEIMKKNFKVHVPLADDMPKKRCSTKPDIVDLCSSNKKPVIIHQGSHGYVCLIN